MKCSRCSQVKSKDDFTKATSGTTRGKWCKDCVRNYNRSYVKTLIGHKNKVKAVAKWQRKNPEKQKIYARQSGLRQRFFILSKTNFKCFYCGRGTQEVSLQIDHIIPRAKGGIDNLENLIPACVECNIGKSDSLLKTYNKLL
jgi:5-methylcytosine-specific restriction endonuclease McrA